MVLSLLIVAVHVFCSGYSPDGLRVPANQKYSVILDGAWRFVVEGVRPILVGLRRRPRL